MANVITTLLKLDGTQFKTGMRSAQQSIKETDGVIGKAKAGWSSMLTGFASSPLAITAAVGAVTAFGTAAVRSFQDAALEAGKFSDATGLTAESASRLLEVAGDVGISAGTIEQAVAKMNQSIGQGGPLIDQYGIALQTTADGAADVNETFIDTVDKINAIVDPTKRAEAAAKVFGRGYKESAELISLSADELRAKLEGVADAQVFGDEQVREARELREEMDNVSDSAARISRAFGETLVPILSDAAATVNNLIDSYDRLRSKTSGSGGPVGGFVSGLLDPTIALSGALDTLNSATARLDQLLGADAPGVRAITEAVTDAADGVDNLNAATDGAADAADQLGSRWSAASIPLEGATGAFAEMGRAAVDATEDVAQLTEAFGPMVDKVDFLAEAFSEFADNLDLQDLLDDITDQFGDVAEAQTKMAEDGEEGVRNYNREVRDLQRELVELVGDIDSIPDAKKVQFISEIERGSIDDLYRILGELTQGIVVPVSFATKSTVGDLGTAGASFNPAAGTITPTFSQPKTATSVVDQRQITINYPIGSTPTTQYVDGQIDLRRNGIR